MPEPRYNRFDFQVNPWKRMLYVRARGNWELPLTRKFGAALHEQLSAINRDGALWCALLNLQDFYPLVPEVADLLSEQLLFMEQQGVRRIAYLGKRKYTDYKLAPWYQAGFLPQALFFDSTAEAVDWFARRSATCAARTA